jgi:OOP family OmpA-OmpF porin
MADTSASGAHTRGDTTYNDTVENGLAELRHLLLSPEQRQLDELRARLDTMELGVDHVSHILPEAIAQRGHPDRPLTTALLPSVEDAIKISVTRSPQTLVDAIFPVMGPAIRKAIAHALKSMLQSLNQALEHRFSVRGLRWRVEAWQTGKSFAEVVLLHTLLYRVEQVFLIHRETGLLLQHVVAGDATTVEPDMVSGMLTAIQDFVHDSFTVPQDETLETFQVGDLTIWVEQGSQAVLAAVIRGNPPYDLRPVFQDALGTIHRACAQDLASFEGDATPFDMSRPQLEDCLVYQAEERRHRFLLFFWSLLLFIVVGLGAAGYLWLYLPAQEQQRWLDYVQRLRTQPGIVVTEVSHRQGTYVVNGLRDPLAADPEQLRQTSGVSAARARSRWEPYHALYPPFIIRRAQQRLEPPASVTLRYDNGVLYISGEATHAWIAAAERLAPGLPGIQRVQRERLVDTDAREMRAITAALAPPDSVTLTLENGVLYATGAAPHAWITAAHQRLHNLPQVSHLHTARLLDLDQQRLAQSVERIERRILLFEVNTDDLLPAQKPRVTRLVTDLQYLFNAARSLRKAVQVTILGHADQSGTEQRNLSMSQRRAESVRDLLVEQGIDPSMLAAAGVGTKAPLWTDRADQAPAFNRSVSFRVVIFDDLNR